MTKFAQQIITLALCFNAVFGRIYSIENADGSYSTSFGLSSDSQGEPANSVLALLTKAAGYTIDDVNEDPLNNNEPQTPQVAPNFNFDIPQNIDLAQESKNLLSPHLEILNLVEVFLKLKGELASRVYDVISDNSELIRSITNTVISKISTLHSFTLTGIFILRKILEFAVTLLGQWHITLPSFSFNVNKGFQGYGNGQASSGFFNANFN